MLEAHPEIYQKNAADLIRIALVKEGERDGLLIREILERLENVGRQIPDLLLKHECYDDLRFLLDRGHDINVKAKDGSTLKIQPDKPSSDGKDIVKPSWWKRLLGN